MNQNSIDRLGAMIAANALPITDTVEGEYITALQAQLAERDRVILEQQARISSLRKILIAVLDDRNPSLVQAMNDDNLSALEAALKSERLVGKIEGLEEAADNFEQWSTSYCGVEQERIFSSYSTELRRMANELKK